MRTNLNSIEVSGNAKETFRTIVDLNSLFIETYYHVLPSIDSQDADDIKEYFLLLQSRLIDCLDLQLSETDKTDNQ